MNIFAHLLIGASYAVVAAFVAFIAPQYFSGLGVVESVVYGCAIFLFGVQLHFLVIWKLSREDITNRLLALHQDYQVSLEKWNETQDELENLRTLFHKNEAGRNAEIVSEMKVLQTLLNQVVEKSGRSFAQQSLLDHEGGVNSQGLDNEEGGDKGRSESEVLNIMHHALEDNRVDLYLQAIVALPSRKTVHYEAYSRVRDEEDKVIFPSQYIRLAEDKGLVGTLDNLLLFRCIQVIRRLGPRRPDIRFFCNISSVSLNDKEFFPQFIDFMVENYELADRLVFEFSQQDVMRHSPQVERSLTILGRKGFRFSMDQVMDMHMDIADLSSRYFRYIKLDPTTIMTSNGDIHPDDLKESFSRYNIELIVEKVEDESTIVEILDLGFDFGQGYLFGEPKISSDATIGL